MKLLSSSVVRSLRSTIVQQCLLRSRGRSQSLRQVLLVRQSHPQDQQPVPSTLLPLRCRRRRLFWNDANNDSRFSIRAVQPKHQQPYRHLSNSHQQQQPQPQPQPQSQPHQGPHRLPLRRRRRNANSVVPRLGGGVTATMTTKWRTLTVMTTTAALSDSQRSINEKCTTGISNADVDDDDDEEEDDDNGVPFPKGMTKETRELATTFRRRSQRQRNDGRDDGSSMEEEECVDDSSSSKMFWKRRMALSKTITLVESSNPDHHHQAALLLTYLLRQQQQQPQQQRPHGSDGTVHPHNNNNNNHQHHHTTTTDYFRVGIAGPPGAGKSSLIEALGRYVLQLSNNGGDDDSPTATSDDGENSGTAERSGGNPTHNKKKKVDRVPDPVWKPGSLSVICIDPSSVGTGGSLLGDKTRMNELSRDVRAYIRPAPTKGKYGGLAPRTDDVVRIIAACGMFPLILIETVGLGQSELDIAKCVDMVVLAIPPGGGDSLQGVKKGIVEIADAIVVTKADGSLLSTARTTAADYRGAIQFVNSLSIRDDSDEDDDDDKNDHDDGCSSTSNTIPILLVSSVTGTGMEQLWETISDFRRRKLVTNNVIHRRRKSQDHYWMWNNVQTLVQDQIEQPNPIIQERARVVLQQLDSGSIPPRVAASMLLETIFVGSKIQ